MPLTLLEIRNKLYDALPGGDVRAWDLVLILQQHLADLDQYINAHEGGENHTVSDISDYVREKLLEMQDRHMKSFNGVIERRDKERKEVAIMMHDAWDNMILGNMEEVGKNIKSTIEKLDR